MKKTLGLLNAAVLVVMTGLIAPCHAQSTPSERIRWAGEAKNVTIVRDDWGIAHVRQDGCGCCLWHDLRAVRG
jgi:acyl-homoserine lactone acylase PvdQ